MSKITIATDYCHCIGPIAKCIFVTQQKKEGFYVY